MTFILSNDQIVKLGTILKDEKAERDLEHNATIICQYSDILFGESEENRVQKLCTCNSKGEISISCKERSMIIRAGFIASMRGLMSEKIVNNQTMAKIIRILRRLLRGANWLPIDCIVQRDMIEGLALFVRNLPDFNSIKVLQKVLSSYLFWCYMQSEDEFVINNSKLLLCVTTWLKENNTSINHDAIQQKEHKCGLTPASQELINRILNDFSLVTKQYYSEYKTYHVSRTSDKKKAKTELFELKKRIVKDLKLASVLIKYSGVYTNDDKCEHKIRNNSGIKNIDNANVLIGTIIIPQILDLLAKVRLYTLELLNCLVNTYLVSFSLQGENCEAFNALELLNTFIALIYGNSNQKKSFIGVNNTDIKNEFVEELNYIYDLTKIENEILFNLLECSGSTGLTVYSPLIQNYMLNIFSIECSQSYIIGSSIEAEKTRKFINNYFSSIIFILMGVPVFDRSIRECNYETFLTFKSCVGMLRFYNKLFKEISNIQEYVLKTSDCTSIYNLDSNKHQGNLYNYNSSFNTKQINELLLKSMSIYELALSIILGFRNTRIAKEVNQTENISELIISCYRTTVDVLYNIVVNNCQAYSNPFKDNFGNITGSNNVTHTTSEARPYLTNSNKKNHTLIELSYHIVNAAVSYYNGDDATTDPILFEKVHDIIKKLHFIFGDNYINEKISNIFSIVSNKLHSLKRENKTDDCMFTLKRSVLSPFVEEDDIILLDCNQDEDFQLDFLLNRNVPTNFLNESKSDDELSYEKPKQVDEHNSQVSKEHETCKIDQEESNEEHINGEKNICDDDVHELEGSSDSADLEFNINDIELNMESSSEDED